MGSCGIHPILEAGLVRPLVRVLHLPRPHDPARPTALVRLRLRLPVLPHELFVLLAERGCLARQAHTGADGGRTVQGTIVARALEAAEQVRPTVIVRRRPLADDS